MNQSLCQIILLTISSSQITPFVASAIGTPDGVTATQDAGLPGNTDLNIVSLAHTPVCTEKLLDELSYYAHIDKDVLTQGFLSGFSLNYSGPREPTEAQNLKSARENPHIVRQKIHKELVAGTIAGPFTYRPLPNLRISPIGLVPKKALGEFRLIHHLSYPKGSSLNDFIDHKLCSVQYTSFDEAIHMLQDLGKHCALWKMDLKNAFRLLPVHPADFDQLGFMFEGEIFVDKSLPFGCSISCSLFEKFATFLEFCVKRRMQSGKLIHYLDDYLGGDEDHVKSKALMTLFQSCLMHLNVPIADEKTVGPATVLCFLGLELDSDKMVVRMPNEKIEEILVRIRDILGKEKVTLRVMQQLIGVLNFACRAIAPGRPFCRRLINSICGLSKPHHHIRVNAGMRQDLNMWRQFFEKFNGISVFYDRHWVSNADVQFFTDSAGGLGLGFGIYFQGRWCRASWPARWHEKGVTKDITFLEMFPIVVALDIWGSELRNKKIKFQCDNQAVVHILNSMTSKSDRVMGLVRSITLSCLELNILIKALHIPGVHNDICDALSRLQLQRFRQLAPDAEVDPHPVPSHLWSAFAVE